MSLQRIFDIGRGIFALLLMLFGLGGAKCPPPPPPLRDFTKYLRNGLPDFYQTRSSFGIRNLMIGHSLLPWLPISGESLAREHDQSSNLSIIFF